MYNENIEEAAFKRDQLAVGLEVHDSNKVAIKQPFKEVLPAEVDTLQLDDSVFSTKLTNLASIKKRDMLYWLMEIKRFAVKVGGTIGTDGQRTAVLDKDKHEIPLPDYFMMSTPGIEYEISVAVAYITSLKDAKLIDQMLASTGTKNAQQGMEVEQLAQRQ
jgi:hypothetical protein